MERYRKEVAEEVEKEKNTALHTLLTLREQPPSTEPAPVKDHEEETAEIKESIMKKIEVHLKAKGEDEGPVKNA